MQGGKKTIRVRTVALSTRKQRAHVTFDVIILTVYASVGL